MTKVDLSDYFFHLPNKPVDRQFVRFIWLGKKYQCTAMLFSLAPAGSKDPAARHPAPRKLGVRGAVYIDAILVITRRQDESLRHTQLLVDTLQHFSVSVHPDMMQAVPTHFIGFLGIQSTLRLLSFEFPGTRIVTFAARTPSFGPGTRPESSLSGCSAL